MYTIYIHIYSMHIAFGLVLFHPCQSEPCPNCKLAQMLIFHSDTRPSSYIPLHPQPTWTSDLVRPMTRTRTARQSIKQWEAELETIHEWQNIDQGCNLGELIAVSQSKPIWPVLCLWKVINPRYNKRIGPAELQDTEQGWIDLPQNCQA